MADFSSLINPAPPPNVTTSGASSNGLPDWYQQYIRGIGGNALNLGVQYGSTPLPARSVAGFNPDQYNAMTMARNNVGSWRPQLNEAQTSAGGITQALQQGQNTANNAVAGPAQNWNQNFQQYMSPYTQGVVDNIARLGNRNFNENIAPGINDQMVGSGQFGSTRNADVLGRAGRDVQADISGQQAGALEQGYGTSANIFANDANRAQQQQGMQASTALGGATAVAGGMGTQSQLMGGLGQATAALNLGDAQTQGAIGAQQQQLQQQGYDANYANDMQAYNQPWDVLNNVSGVVRGQQLPSSSTFTSNGPISNQMGPSGLGALGAAYGALSTQRPAAPL